VRKSIFVGIFTSRRAWLWDLYFEKKVRKRRQWEGAYSAYSAYPKFAY
jgi:hypothetical protein